jgi:hypothetical protein
VENLVGNYTEGAEKKVKLLRQLGKQLKASISPTSILKTSKAIDWKHPGVGMISTKYTHLIVMPNKLVGHIVMMMLSK